MAKISYAAGIPALPAKWEKILSGLLDSIGMASITLTSTHRSLDSNSTAMYNNILNLGAEAEMKLYNAAMQQVVRTGADMIAAGYGQADTVAAMTRKTQSLGATPVHCRQQDDNFAVFDVPPSYIPDNMKAAFENVVSNAASKFIRPGNDPVYHVEFGGVKASTIAAVGIGSAAVVAAVAAALFLRK